MYNRWNMKMKGWDENHEVTLHMIIQNYNGISRVLPATVNNRKCCTRISMEHLIHHTCIYKYCIQMYGYG